MRKYLFLLFLLTVSVFGAVSKDNTQILTVASKEPGDQLVASTTSGMSGVIIKWVKEDSLKIEKLQFYLKMKLVIQKK